MPLSYLKSSVHNHSTYCDGKNSLRQMVQAACEQGIEVIGFSGHSHTPCDSEYCMTLKGTEQYKTEIFHLKEEYAEKIQILCGLEWDQFSDDDIKSYEYSIGSVHYLLGPKTGIYHPIDYRPQDLTACLFQDFEGNGLAMAESYFKSVRQVAEARPTILGHFDLIKKLNGSGDYFDEALPKYKEIVFDALKACKENVNVLEINTGGVKRGYRADFYPSDEALSYWRQLGGEVVITADSHDTESIVWGFQEAAAAAVRAGYTRTMVMNGSGGFDFCEI